MTAPESLEEFEAKMVDYDDQDGEGEDAPVSGAQPDAMDAQNTFVQDTAIQYEPTNDTSNRPFDPYNDPGDTSPLSFEETEVLLAAFDDTRRPAFPNLRMPNIWRRVAAKTAAAQNLPDLPSIPLTAQQIQSIIRAKTLRDRAGDMPLDIYRDRILGTGVGGTTLFADAGYIPILAKVIVDSIEQYYEAEVCAYWEQVALAVQTISGKWRNVGVLQERYQKLLSGYYSQLDGADDERVQQPAYALQTPGSGEEVASDKSPVHGSLLDGTDDRPPFKVPTQESGDGSSLSRTVEKATEKTDVPASAFVGDPQPKSRQRRRQETPKAIQTRGISDESPLSHAEETELLAAFDDSRPQSQPNPQPRHPSQLHISLIWQTLHKQLFGLNPPIHLTNPSLQAIVDRNLAHSSSSSASIPLWKNRILFYGIREKHLPDRVLLGRRYAATLSEQVLDETVRRFEEAVRRYWDDVSRALLKISGKSWRDRRRREFLEERLEELLKQPASRLPSAETGKDPTTGPESLRDQHQKLGDQTSPTLILQTTLPASNPSLPPQDAVSDDHLH